MTSAIKLAVSHDLIKVLTHIRLNLSWPSQLPLCLYAIVIVIFIVKQVETTILDEWQLLSTCETWMSLPIILRFTCVGYVSSMSALI
jgi:hypothetical protein